MVTLTRRQRREATERALGFLGWRRFRKAVIGGLIAGSSAVAAQLPTLDWTQVGVQEGSARLVLTVAATFAGAAGVYWTRNASAQDPLAGPSSD